MDELRKMPQEDFLYLVQSVLRVASPEQAARLRKVKDPRSVTPAQAMEIAVLERKVKDLRYVMPQQRELTKSQTANQRRKKKREEDRLNKTYEETCEEITERLTRGLTIPLRQPLANIRTSVPSGNGEGCSKRPIANTQKLKGVVQGNSTIPGQKIPVYRDFESSEAENLNSEEEQSSKDLHKEISDEEPTAMSTKLCNKCSRGRHDPKTCQDKEWMAGYKSSNDYGKGLLNTGAAPDSQYSTTSQNPTEDSLRGRLRAEGRSAPAPVDKETEPCFNCWETDSHDEATCRKPLIGTQAREQLRCHYKKPVTKGWHRVLKDLNMLPPLDERKRREEEAEHYRKWLKESRGTGTFNKQQMQADDDEAAPRPRRRTAQEKENEKALEDALRKYNKVRQMAGQEESKILEAKNRIQASIPAKDALEEARQTIREGKDYVANAQLSYERAAELFGRTDNQVIFDTELPPILDTVFKQIERAKSFLQPVDGIITHAYELDNREKARVKEVEKMQNARMNELVRERARQEAGNRRFNKERYPTWDREPRLVSERVDPRASNSKTASVAAAQEMPAPKPFQSVFNAQKKNDSLIDLTDGIGGMSKNRDSTPLDAYRPMVPTPSPANSRLDKRSERLFASSVRESSDARSSTKNRNAAEKAAIPQTSESTARKTGRTAENSVFSSDDTSPTVVEQSITDRNGRTTTAEVKNILIKFTAEMKDMGNEARKFYTSINNNILLLIEKVEDRKAFAGQHLPIPAVNMGDDDGEPQYSELQAVKMLKEALNDLTLRVDSCEKQPQDSSEGSKLMKQVGERLDKCELILEQYNKKNDTSLRNIMEHFTNQVDEVSDRMSKFERTTTHQSRKNGDNIDNIKDSLESENRELAERVEELEEALNQQGVEFYERLSKLEDRHNSKKRSVTGNTSRSGTKHKSSRGVASESKDTAVISQDEDNTPSTPKGKVKSVPPGSFTKYHPGTSATRETSTDRAAAGNDYVTQSPATAAAHSRAGLGYARSPTPAQRFEATFETAGGTEEDYVRRLKQAMADPNPMTAKRMLAELVTNVNGRIDGGSLAGTPDPEVGDRETSNNNRSSSVHNSGHKYTTRSAMAHRGGAHDSQY